MPPPRALSKLHYLGLLGTATTIIPREEVPRVVSLIVCHTERERESEGEGEGEREEGERKDHERG